MFPPLAPANTVREQRFTFIFNSYLPFKLISLQTRKKVVQDDVLEYLSLAVCLYCNFDAIHIDLRREVVLFM